MREYALRRTLMVFPVLILVSMMIFVLMRLLPGDITTLLTDRPFLKHTEELKKMLGFDRPIYVQYFAWAAQLLKGDLGKSLYTGRPVISEIGDSLPVTIELAILSMVFSVVAAIPLGVISAVRQNSIWDFLARIFSISGLSIPFFWIATLFLVFSSVYFRWVPPIKYVHINDDPLSNLIQFGIPALIGSYRSMGVTARMTRSTLLDVLRQDYIRTAWAKGLRGRIVLFNHALKNAMIPVITIIGNQFAFLLGGLVITETIFGLPGVGRLLITSIEFRDYTVVQGVVLFTAVAVVIANLVVDLSYTLFDPRIRYE